MNEPPQPSYVLLEAGTFGSLPKLLSLTSLQTQSWGWGGGGSKFYEWSEFSFPSKWGCERYRTLCPGVCLPTHVEVFVSLPPLPPTLSIHCGSAHVFSASSFGKFLPVLELYKMPTVDSNFLLRHQKTSVKTI
jgi:hypothetical protein